MDSVIDLSHHQNEHCLPLSSASLRDMKTLHRSIGWFMVVERNCNKLKATLDWIWNDADQNSNNSVQAKPEMQEMGLLMDKARGHPTKKVDLFFGSILFIQNSASDGSSWSIFPRGKWSLSDTEKCFSASRNVPVTTVQGWKTVKEKKAWITLWDTICTSPLRISYPPTSLAASPPSLPVNGQRNGERLLDQQYIDRMSKS